MPLRETAEVGEFAIFEHGETQKFQEGVLFDLPPLPGRGGVDGGATRMAR